MSRALLRKCKFHSSSKNCSVPVVWRVWHRTELWSWLDRTTGHYTQMTAPPLHPHIIIYPTNTSGRRWLVVCILLWGDLCDGVCCYCCIMCWRLQTVGVQLALACSAWCHACRAYCVVLKVSSTLAPRCSTQRRSDCVLRLGASSNPTRLQVCDLVNFTAILQRAVSPLGAILALGTNGR